jgi:BirA family transcriptional regulator, biotin operon repressor / biotin---[acetyl-CoA-carboxylase] ligase
MNIDTAILTAIRRAGEAGLAGADLAQRLGVSRAAVWARIEELRGLGYDIEASPHRGYHLVSAPDLLHADDLLSRLDGATRCVGRDIRVFEETTSTNDIIEKLARDGVKEGAVVFAEAQTRGRGRLGRRWASPVRKGLWFSVLLRPPLRPQAATQLTVAAAVALGAALREEYGCMSSIKWPNDILLRGRKVAGILTEMSAELDCIKHVVLGIGLNANLAAGDFPMEFRRLATSLRVELGRAVDRPALAVTVLRHLDAAYALVCAGQFARVADEWAGQCSTLGRRVRIEVGGRTVAGQAEALDEDGALLVRTQHGRLERIVGGDVTLEK